MSERPVELQSARAQAAAIAAKEISAAELLDRVLARYEKHNPEINAVIVTRIDVARDRAAAADAATAAGESWGPLHGVPITVKEAFDWEGTPTTWGIPDLKDNIADTNAVAVDRLLDAGAVLYGKTNVPYGLADWQSFNAIYGTTNNPWDITRVPGGSSGGSAAALATGMSSLEFGSDIGASIRNPAHYCGVLTRPISPSSVRWLELPVTSIWRCSSLPVRPACEPVAIRSTWKRCRSANHPSGA